MNVSYYHYDCSCYFRKTFGIVTSNHDNPSFNNSIFYSLRKSGTSLSTLLSIPTEKKFLGWLDGVVGQG